MARTLSLAVLAATLLAGTAHAKDTGGSGWWDNTTFFSDFRFRLDNDTRDGDGIDSKAEARTRPRLRARVGLKAKTPVDGLTFGVRLASNIGTPGNSPHQTLGLGIGGGGHIINIDRAFLKYAFLDGFALTLGKFGLPGWHQSEVFWDGDIQPEGGVLAWSKKFGDHKVGVHAGYFLLNNEGWTEGLFGNDAALNWQVSYGGGFGKVAATVAFTGLHIFDRGPNSNIAGADENSPGIDSDDTMFLVGSLQVKTKGLPVNALLGFEYLMGNTDAEGVKDESKSGFVAQGRVTWKWLGLRYYFYSVGEAAVPYYAGAALSQDNFPNSRGGGLTGFDGHRIQLDFKPAKRVSLDFRVYMQEGKEDNVLAFAETPKRSINRYQLNLNLKF